jgi:hypothetical protein
LEEVATDTQWGANENVGQPPYDFEGFTQSTETAYVLGVNFLLFYERPHVQDSAEQQERGNYATYWYEHLTGETGGGSNGGFIPKSSFKIFNYMRKRRVIIK